MSWSSGRLLAALGGLPLLKQQLAAMRNLYLGGCPALLLLVHSLVSALLGGRLLTQLPASALQASLEDCLNSGQQTEPLPSVADVTGGCQLGTGGSFVGLGMLSLREGRYIKQMGARENVQQFASLIPYLASVYSRQ